MKTLSTKSLNMHATFSRRIKEGFVHVVYMLISTTDNLLTMLNPKYAFIQPMDSAVLNMSVSHGIPGQYHGYNMDTL